MIDCMPFSFSSSPCEIITEEERIEREEIRFIESFEGQELH